MLSDEDLWVIDLYGVAKEERTGPKRSIFVVDVDGTLIFVNPRYEAASISQYKEIVDALKKG